MLQVNMIVDNRGIWAAEKSGFGDFTLLYDGQEG